MHTEECCGGFTGCGPEGKTRPCCTNAPGALSFPSRRATKAPAELHTWARTVSYTGAHTLGEMGALACSYEQVQLRSLNQEPNVLFGPVLHVQVSDNGLEITIMIYPLVLPAGPLHYIDYIKLYPNSVDTVFLGITVLLLVLTNLGYAYGLGIMTWTLIISGWHIRELSQAFEFELSRFTPTIVVASSCWGISVLVQYLRSSLLFPMVVAMLAISFSGPDRVPMPENRHRRYRLCRSLHIGRDQFASRIDQSGQHRGGRLERRTDRQEMPSYAPRHPVR